MNVINNMHKKIRIIDVIESIMRALEQFDEFDVTVAMEMFEENSKMDDEERVIMGLVTLIVGNLGDKTDLSKQEVDIMMGIALKASRAVRKTAKNRITH